MNEKTASPKHSLMNDQKAKSKVTKSYRGRERGKKSQLAIKKKKKKSAGVRLATNNTKCYEIMSWYLLSSEKEPSRPRSIYPKSVSANSEGKMKTFSDL